MGLIDISMLGFSQVQAKLAMMARRVDPETDTTVRDLAQNLVDTARSRVPVRTGAARNSIRLDGDDFVAGGASAPYFRIILPRSAQRPVHFDGSVWGSEIREGYQRIIEGAGL